MKRATLTGICVLGLTAAIACNRPPQTDDQLSEGPFEDERATSPIGISGCLTSEGGRFVLTQLDPGSTPVPSTEMYQLTNADEDLRPHVGRIVQVFGAAPSASIAELRETEPAPIGTSGQNQAEPDGLEPQVTTSQAARFEARTLRVSSVIPTEQPCESGQPSATP
jgi:hypothetical protein